MGAVCISTRGCRMNLPTVISRNLWREVVSGPHQEVPWPEGVLHLRGDRAITVTEADGKIAAYAWTDTGFCFIPVTPEMTSSEILIALQLLPEPGTRPVPTSRDGLFDQYL